MSKPKEPVQTGQHDLFRARLDQIIDMKHPTDAKLIHRARGSGW